MQKFQAKLVRLVNEKIITHKDAALIILAKDGLKPLSSVGFFSSLELIEILQDYDIHFVIRDGRINIGNLAHKETLDGQTFGFPSCCSTAYTDTLMSRRKMFSTCSPYVFHIPCSKGCKETEQLARKYMFYIKLNYPIVAEHIEKNLAEKTNEISF
jgi:hypothetical protein